MENPLSEEQKAFAERLFTENYKLLSRRAYELLRNIDPSAAEDCLGNLFLTLCLSVQRIMEHENPRAWMFLTLKYICLKHIRKFGAECGRTLPLNEDIDMKLSDISFEEKIIDDILYSQWENQKIKERLIGALNENEREILRLRFEEGLSNREIGERLGKTEDAVRFTVYYTKKKITEKIYSL